MPETKSSTPEPSQDPKDQTQTEDVLPETTSQRTYLQDDGYGPLPDGVVEHPEPVTYLADHVPEGAPAVLTTKVVKPAPAEDAQSSTAQVRTASGRDIPLEGVATLSASAAQLPHEAA